MDILQSNIEMILSVYKYYIPLFLKDDFYCKETLHLDMLVRLFKKTEPTVKSIAGCTYITF